MIDVQDSQIAGGVRAVPRGIGPAFGCPSTLPSARSSSCRCPVFEVFLRMDVAVIPGLLQPLTKSLQHYHYH